MIDSVGVSHKAGLKQQDAWRSSKRITAIPRSGKAKKSGAISCPAFCLTPACEKLLHRNAQPLQQPAGFHAPQDEIDIHTQFKTCMTLHVEQKLIYFYQIVSCHGGITLLQKLAHCLHIASGDTVEPGSQIRLRAQNIAYLSHILVIHGGKDSTNGSSYLCLPKLAQSF